MDLTKSPQEVFLGNPPSALHQPSQAETAQLLDEMVAEIEGLQAPVADLDTRVTAVEGISTTGAVPKGSVATVALTNITLSGVQTVAGVATDSAEALAKGVLVVGQSAPAENGVWIPGAGAWTRRADLDAAAEFAKASVYVDGGTYAGRTYWQTATVTTLGTDAVVWSMIKDDSVLFQGKAAQSDLEDEIAARRMVIDVLDTPIYLYGQTIVGWIRDSDGRVALAVTSDGTILGKLGLDAGPNGTITRDPATGRYRIGLGTVEGRLPLGGDAYIGAAEDRWMHGSRVLWGVPDSAGRLGLAVTEDGAASAHKLRIGGGGAVISEMAAEPRYIDGYRIVGSVPDRNGRHALAVTEDGRTHVHSLVVGSHNISVPEPTEPETALLDEIVLYGNSLTAPSANTAAWASATGLPVHNRGIGGQWMRQISARGGGYVVSVTVASDQLVSGANVITHFDGQAVVATSGAWQSQILSTPSDGATRSIKGYLGLILGTMTRSTASGTGSAETYTFTPDGGQTLPVNCPPGTAFVVAPEVVDEDHRRIAVFSGFRNGDWSNPAGEIAELEALVRRWEERGNTRFVILTGVNGNYSTERKGQARYAQLLVQEQMITKRWPQNTYNARRWLIDRGLAALSITPTTQDETDIADDTIPASLRTDNVHWISGVYAAMVPAIISTVITPKGWLA